MTYVIEALYTVGCGRCWERLPDQDGYTSTDEAEMAIERLRELGDDWATGEYRVVEEPEKQP